MPLVQVNFGPSQAKGKAIRQQGAPFPPLALPWCSCMGTTFLLNLHVNLPHKTGHKSSLSGSLRQVQSRLSVEDKSKLLLRTISFFQPVQSEPR